jgi:hypothetical protein
MKLYTSIFQSVWFVEGRPPEAQIIRPIRVELGGFFRSAQLKTLDDVKLQMVKGVLEAGGNAVVNFKYGQKSVGILASLFQRDDINWYGYGDIALIPNVTSKVNG